MDENEREVASPGFSLRQRIALWWIALAGVIVIRLIGPTLRFEFSAEDGTEDAKNLPEPASVVPFWHRITFAAAYHARGRKAAIMISRSFDGEYIARIAKHFGIDPVRGSSSRGGVAALMEMYEVVRQGSHAVFTVDGPRGPKYVAKPGPLLLAKKTGAGIRCFYIAVSHGWTLHSWDELVIPRPFARAHMRWSRRIMVPATASDAEMKALLEEMQAALDRITAEAEQAVGARV